MSYRIRPLWTNQPTWLDAVLSSKLRATRALECGLSVRYNRIVTSCSLFKHTTFDTKQPAYQTYSVTQLRWFGGLARDKLEQQVWCAQLSSRNMSRLLSEDLQFKICRSDHSWRYESSSQHYQIPELPQVVSQLHTPCRHHCVTAWLRAQTYNRWSSKG